LTIPEYEKRLAESVDHSFNTDITIDTFARIINEVRNIFAHEGSYWEFHFSDGNMPLINILKLAETFEEYKSVRNGKKEKEERIYNIGLSYLEFRRICVRGFINFIYKYLESIKS